MKQKIEFKKDVKNNVLTVVEFSEVDPGVIMPLLEETYDLDQMKAASAGGVQAFTSQLRRKSFFPISDLSNKLYESTLAFFKADQEKISVEYDDSESFPGEEDFSLDDDVEFDKILEEDGDSKEDEIKEIDTGDDTPKFMPEDISEHEN